MITDYIDMYYMRFKGLSQTDVQNLSAILGCTPVCLDDSIEFIEDSSFDGEELFKNTYSQVTSAKLRMKTTTAYRLMEIMSYSGDSKNAILRKALSPAISEKIDSYMNLIKPEKVEILRFVLHEWIKNSATLDYPETCRTGISSIPVMKIVLDDERVPEKLAVCMRVFLKSLFQMNNMFDGVPTYTPQIVEELWDDIMPDTGMFSAEICPHNRKLSVTVCNSHSQFIVRKNNDSHESIIEVLLLESRHNKIKNCRINTCGMNLEDEFTIQELKSVESELIGNCIMPHELSKEGLDLIHRLLSKIEDLQADVMYPCDPKLCTLTFDLDLENDLFTLDGVKVCDENQELLENVVRSHMKDMAKNICGIQLDYDKHELYSRINELLDSEEDKIDDEILSEVIRLNAAYDYCCSLDSCSQIICKEIITYLQSMKEMSFTIPSMLLTLLNCALSEKSADELLSNVTK